MHEGNAARPRPVNRLKLAIYVTELVLIGLLIGVIVARGLHKDVALPSSIVSQLGFTAHLPQKFPGAYEIDQTSFVYSNGVLSYTVGNGTGSTIAFTEQRKPDGLDFDDFYDQQMTEAQTLGGTPFPSVAGKSTIAENRMLSIVTNDSWVLANTKAPLNNQDLQLIAQHLKPVGKKS